MTWVLFCPHFDTYSFTIAYSFTIEIDTFISTTSTTLTGAESRISRAETMAELLTINLYLEFVPGEARAKEGLDVF